MAIVNEEDVEIIDLDGGILPDIFVIHKPSGLAIRVQDQVTVENAVFVGKARLSVCVEVLQEFASRIDLSGPPAN